MSCRKLLPVLCDLSGTIHVEDVGIPGCIGAVKRLRSLPNVRLKFVTNTTKECQRSLHERLLRIGFDVEKRDLFTSLTAAKRLIEVNGFRPMLILEEAAMEDFQGIDTTNPDTVVVGLAPGQFHYERLNDAFRLLLNGAKLIAIHKGRYFKRKDGLVLGPGPFVQAMEYATDCKSEVVGKPSASFYAAALEELKRQEETNECDIEWLTPIMIGDDARDDVIGAQDAGFKGLLVKTGKYRYGDETRFGQPFRICDDFADAVSFIEEMQQLY